MKKVFVEIEGKLIDITDLDKTDYDRLKYEYILLQEDYRKELRKNKSSINKQRKLLETFCEYTDLYYHAHPDDIVLDIENHLILINK